MLLTSLVFIKLQATGNKERDVLPFAVHQIVSPLWKTEVDQVHILQSAETVQYHHQQTIQMPHDPKALHPLTKHSYACYKLNGVATHTLLQLDKEPVKHPASTLSRVWAGGASGKATRSPPCLSFPKLLVHQSERPETIA